MVDVVQCPDFECVLRVGGSDVAVIAFFRSTAGDFDALVGVEDPTQGSNYAHYFDLASYAVEVAQDWVTLSERDSGELPF